MGKPTLNTSMQLVFGGNALTRANEEDDAEFYVRSNLVSHLDARALVTIEKLIQTLVVEPNPEILDLMAGWDSHLAAEIAPKRVVGIGLCERELKRNDKLDEWLRHDLNREPNLPFGDESFDVVLSTNSVAYMTQPFDVFAEVARVLRPGGLHLVLFSDRHFAEKAVRVWYDSSPSERKLVVEDYFAACGDFEKPKTFLWSGTPRPSEDEEAEALEFSDPVHAVYADKLGGDAQRPARPKPSIALSEGPSREQVEERKARVRDTLRCPYCEEKMTFWNVPDTPFCEWDIEHVYVCFNNLCSYFVGGFDAMGAQGNPGFSYRCVYNPERNSFHPAVVPNAKTVRRSTLMPRG